MKKIIATVIIVLAVIFTPQGVYADSEEQNNEYYDRLISEINEGLSFEGDEDVKTVLEDNNITLEDPSSAANISASDVIKHIFESFTAALRSPLIMLGKITAATMLCVLVRSMSAEGTVDKVFTLICVLTTVLVISDTVTDRRCKKKAQQSPWIPSIWKPTGFNISHSKKELSNLEKRV